MRTTPASLRSDPGRNQWNRWPECLRMGGRIEWNTHPYTTGLFLMGEHLKKGAFYELVNGVTGTP